MLKFFHPPPIDSEDQARQTQVINTILLIVLVGSVLFFLLAGVAWEANQMIMSLASGMFLFVLGLKALLNRGHDQLVNYLLSLALWIAFSVPIYVFDGIRDVAISGYFLAMAITGLVLRGNRLFSFVVLASLSVTGAYLAEIRGILVTSFEILPAPIDLLTLLITLNATALLTRITIKRMIREEEKVRLARDKAQQYLDIAGAIIIALDLTGAITLINRWGCQALGYEEEEILGKNWIDEMVHPNQQDEIRDQYHKILTDQSTPPVFMEYVMIAKGGQERDTVWNATTLTNEDGEIIGTLNSGRDITDRVELEKQLTHLATYDYLTDLPNRMLFNDRLEIALAQAQRYGSMTAVMMMDLDQFKEVNDTLGHDVGDELLKKIGKRIKDLLRKSDTVARMGGDEFGLVLPVITKREDAGKVAAKILGGFNQPFVVGEHPLSLGVSIGIAVYPDDGDSGADLMKKADIAMYRAKGERSNSYQYFLENGIQI
ncbi:MAG: sensor domain-containing diguanylate cyclase [Anaerolineales bacterium]|nr:sensor domain-containing diguanylate cyclase [Anaerolineales bacterium]